MVGSYFHSLSEEFGEPLDLTDIDTLDVTDMSLLGSRISSHQYSWVIHLAAETDVDRCEREPAHAFRVNAIGTQNIALACQSAGIGLVYVSTAGVFGGDGALGPFTEYDPPCPANVYGFSKLAGERHVERLLNRYFIVRAGWMMGGKDKDKKFVGKILSQVKAGGDIRAVDDKLGSPTFAKELVAGIRDLLGSGRFGLYHMTNHGSCSRYEIARHIVHFIGATSNVIPVNSAHFPLPAPRANSEAMRNLNLELTGMDRMSSWQRALDAYLEEWLGHASVGAASR
jgi:dTDP-4-dehydrorhamnose reductase